MCVYVCACIYIYTHIYENIYTNRERETYTEQKRAIDHGSLKLSGSTRWVSKLEMQEGRLNCNLIPIGVWRPEKHGSWWCSSRPKARRLDTQEEPMLWFKPGGRQKPMSQLKGSQAGRILSCSGEGHLLCFLQGFNWSGEAHPLPEGTHFAQSADLNVNLIGKHLHRHTRITSDQIATHPVVDMYVVDTYDEASPRECWKANWDDREEWRKQGGQEVGRVTPDAVRASAECSCDLAAIGSAEAVCDTVNSGVGGVWIKR